MHLDVVPRKTDLARDMLKGRDTLPRSQRLFLIMIDGHKSLRELSEPALQLGIDNSALARLANAGLIQWSHDAVAEAPENVSPAPAERNIPLVAVKLYAMDLVALLLPGQDHALRDAARNVSDAESLRVWIACCADEIAQRNHPDRAELFRGRVASQLPSDYFAKVSQQ